MTPLPGLTAVLAVLVSAIAAAPPPSSTGQPPAITSKPVTFSPNGDGVRDLARIRYDLPKASSVSVAVLRYGRKEFRTSLGRQSAGAHTWIWDGRTPGGRRLPHGGSYEIEVRTTGGAARVGVSIDRRFEATVDVLHRFGRPSAETPTVYPHTTVVRDSIDLVAYADDAGFRRAQLQVRDPKGQVVLRRDLVKHPTGFSENDVWMDDPAVWDARDSKDRPLPPGLYTAVVRGVDRVGNAGTTGPLTIRVSRQRLDWVEETRSITPAESQVSQCDRTEAQGCGLITDCGVVVPSVLFAGGLSLRSAVCSDPFLRPGAHSYHRVTVADAVRGIDAYRVSFSGAPTFSGETDPVTLTIETTTLMSSSGAQTPWLTSGPYLDGEARINEFIPPLPPSVWWEMSTGGTDAFDVGSFTVDVRYLAVGD